MRDKFIPQSIRLSLLSIFSFIVLSLISVAQAQVSVNVLAVNGTNDSQEKEIREPLPPELTAEDILDTGELEVGYDASAGSYYVFGTVSLEPKESKTIKVRVNDVWQIDNATIDEIKEQIEVNSEQLKDSEYEEVAELRKADLLQRLNFIVGEQEQNAGNIDKRVAIHRIYAKEFDDIRNSAVSVAYWRSPPPDREASAVFTYVVLVENNSETEERESDTKHYLPKEVKPEHLLDTQGHEIRYDPKRGQPYLTKKEVLQPGESKRYSIEILDVWNVPQKTLDNYKERTNKAYNLLKETKYIDNAKFLVDSITKNVKEIEVSQAIDRDIGNHISAYRSNAIKFEKVVKDVESLELILNILRENLERSKIKNILHKIKSLKSIETIAEAIFGVRPMVNDVWKILIGVVVFVGILTFIHFAIWGRRSKDLKLRKQEEMDDLKK